MTRYIIIGILLSSLVSAAPSIQSSESEKEGSDKIGLVEKLELSLHGDNFCGGDDVYIELIQNSKSCTTRKHGDFDKGDIISWTGSKLGSCLKKEFDIENDQIDFKVRSTYGDDFCPKILEISMNNTVKGITREVVFKSYGLMDDWVDKNKGGHQRSAKRITDLYLCEPNPCQNNGICTDEINKYSCNCTSTGFDGKNCEQEINECLFSEESGVETCQNGGKCVDEIGTFSCDCQKGWEGDFCEKDINECLVGEETGVETCQNGGHCVNKIGNFSCDCPKGWEGDFCETDVNECLVLDPSTVPEIEICQNGGKCVNEIGNFSCDCQEGWEGDFCEKDIDECLVSQESGVERCQNGGICVNEIGNFTCNCPKGWEGDFCEIDVNECLLTRAPGDEFCQNGGKCVNEIGNFSCDCQKGWEGDFCERDADDCFPVNPCPLNKTCIDIGLNDYYCECPKYWEGEACDIPQSKFGVKKVSLEVDPYTGSGGCGGGETKVQIQIESLFNDQCKTKPLQFPTGQTTLWITEDELKDCSQNKKFGADDDRILFKVLPIDKKEWYCIKSLSLILDDENNTTYKEDTVNDWRQGEHSFIGMKQ